jgi:hypothetical protein
MEVIGQIDEPSDADLSEQLSVNSLHASDYEFHGAGANGKAPAASSARVRTDNVFQLRQSTNHSETSTHEATDSSEPHDSEPHDSEPHDVEDLANEVSSAKLTYQASWHTTANIRQTSLWDYLK